MAHSIHANKKNKSIYFFRFGLSEAALAAAASDAAGATFCRLVGAGLELVVASSDSSEASFADWSSPESSVGLRLVVVAGLGGGAEASIDSASAKSKSSDSGAAAALAVALAVAPAVCFCFFSAASTRIVPGTAATATLDLVFDLLSLSLSLAPPPLPLPVPLPLPFAAVAVAVAAAGAEFDLALFGAVVLVCGGGGLMYGFDLIASSARDMIWVNH